MSSGKMVTYDQLMQPLMTALVNLGGSGSIDEIYEAVLELEKLDEETLGILHNPKKQPNGNRLPLGLGAHLSEKSRLS